MCEQADQIRDSVPADVFLPPGIHPVFPRNRSPYPTYTYRFREKIKTYLQNNANISLCVLVNKKLRGTDAQSRVVNAINSTTLSSNDDKIFLPMLMYNSKVSALERAFRNGVILNNIGVNYDPLFVPLSESLNVDKRAVSIKHNRNMFIKWLIKLLIAKDQSPPSMRHVHFSFLKTRSPERFWNRYIESVDMQEVFQVAIETMNQQRFILCPDNEECGRNRCFAFFHLNDFVSVEFNPGMLGEPVENMTAEEAEDEDDVVEADVQIDHESLPHENTKPLYDFQPFLFGLNLFDRSSYTFNEHDQMRDIVIDALIGNLKSSLTAYQLLCSSGCTYLIGGMHVPSGQDTPKNLMLDMITPELKLYIYAGRSRFSGVNAYHILESARSSFSKAVRDLRLNCFWNLCSKRYESSLQSEKHEVVLQLFLRHANRFSPNPNIEICNERVEVSALDVCTDNELEKIVAVLDDQNLPMICNVVTDIPGFNEIDKSMLFMCPIELSKATKLPSTFLDI